MLQYQVFKGLSKAFRSLAHGLWRIYAVINLRAYKLAYDAREAGLFAVQEKKAKARDAYFDGRRRSEDLMEVALRFSDNNDSAYADRMSDLGKVEANIRKESI
jgi:hypothetical protein